MLIDLSTLSDDVTSLVREVPGDALSVPAEDFGIDGPLHLDATLTRKGGGEFLLRGRLGGALRVPCSRCLEPFALSLDGPVDVRLLPVSLLEASDEHEVGDDDLATEFYRDDTLDLGAIVREQCYLALPMKPLCRADCRGLCPQCGVNLNQTTCDCDQTWVDPRLAALKALVPDRSPE